MNAAASVFTSSSTPITISADPSSRISHHLRISGVTPVSDERDDDERIDHRAAGSTAIAALLIPANRPRIARSRWPRLEFGRRSPGGLGLVASSAVLRIVLPKGSLERATLDLFEAADLAVIRSSAVEYRATIDDPRVDEVRILRPQEIPVYVAEGLFDVGVTGRDWVEETGERRRQPR